MIFIQLRTLSHPRLEQLWKPKNRVLLLVWEKSCRFTKKMCPDYTLLCFGRFFASPELCVCSNWHGDPSGSSRSCTQWRRATRTSDSSSPSSSWACSSLAACSTTLRTGSLTLDSTASPRFEAFQRAKESCFYNIEWTPPKFYPFSVFFLFKNVFPPCCPFQGMWWGLQTLTSVGYGDFPVETIAGKLLAAMTAVCGVLVMALPIPIVVDNFAGLLWNQIKSFDFIDWYFLSSMIYIYYW